MLCGYAGAIPSWVLVITLILLNWAGWRNNRLERDYLNSEIIWIQILWSLSNAVLILISSCIVCTFLQTLFWCKYSCMTTDIACLGQLFWDYHFIKEYQCWLFPIYTVILYTIYYIIGLFLLLCSGVSMLKLQKGRFWCDWIAYSSLTIANYW